MIVLEINQGTMNASNYPPRFSKDEITYLFPMLLKSEQEYYADLKLTDPKKAPIYLRERFDVLIQSKPIKLRIINELLQRGPLFAYEMIEPFDCSERGFLFAAQELIDKGLLFSKMVPYKEQQRTRPVYYLAGQDLSRFQTTRIKKIEAMIRARPCTMAELCEKTNSTQAQVRASLYDLHKLKGVNVKREVYYSVEDN